MPCFGSVLIYKEMAGLYPVWFLYPTGMVAGVGRWHVWGGGWSPPGGGEGGRRRAGPPTSARPGSGRTPSLPHSIALWELEFYFQCPPLVLFLIKTKQYQERGIGELDLKIQQAPPLESAGMPRWLGFGIKWNCWYFEFLFVKFALVQSFYVSLRNSCKKIILLLFLYNLYYLSQT